MNNIMTDSIFFGAVISVVGYLIGIFLRKKISVLNPLLVSIIFVIASRESWSNVIISSTRLINSGANDLFKAFYQFSYNRNIIFRRRLRNDFFNEGNRVIQPLAF